MRRRPIYRAGERPSLTGLSCVLLLPSLYGGAVVHEERSCPTLVPPSKKRKLAMNRMKLFLIDSHCTPPRAAFQFNVICACTISGGGRPLWRDMGSGVTIIQRVICGRRRRAMHPTVDMWEYEDNTSAVARH